ncbi:interleukin-1 receptor-associated kinase 4 isoform X2 [Leptinotarsa decemlineata]|uniref:interleukin-1 receptor-associated kinase 4 isoform X2 n=1 Tax=Leptinotarsa decemlineata TaxID=7539 RepID=UPI003D30A4FB
MDPSTEIRKLGPKDVTMLSSILDQNDQWRCLMSIIPEFLQRNDYRCDISDNNPPKYDSEHFRIIDELKKSGRKCTEVLLSEWGCSGRIRPTIGHLLYLLVKANLFRAADYVAMDLLHQEKPKRPCNGPEAQISPNLLRKETSHDQKFSTDNHTARNIHQRIPEIIITDANQEEVECDPPTSLEESVMFPAISVSHNECEFEDSNFLPALSKLHLNSNLGSVTLDISSQGSSDDSIGSASCASPLPVLSLDTRLPHFNYSSLLTATNNFDIRPFSGPNEGGRLLGSGEFGSVFLALGLLDKPVAVKKLFLENEVVSVDDEVTKQFRNEVEVLSKYKHENLLNLLGFSCDGCTYCLLYDFIPGGSLKNRLQEPENVLKWKSRLSISIGISKAVSYLHAAFATPLIHRDINSSNILLVSDNNPKLADFGLIKLIPNQNNAVATMVYGTSAYMAREAFGGDISVKLDTFSFGVVLLELITSLPPLDDNRTGNDLVTHIEETIDDDNILPLVDNRAGSWEEENVNYAVELFKVAQSCLKEKRKRPTMVDVKMTLDELTKNVNLIEF